MKEYIYDLEMLQNFLDFKGTNPKSGRGEFDYVKNKNIIIDREWEKMIFKIWQGINISKIQGTSMSQ